MHVYTDGTVSGYTVFAQRLASEWADFLHCTDRSSCLMDRIPIWPAMDKSTKSDEQATNKQVETQLMDDQHVERTGRQSASRRNMLQLLGLCCRRCWSLMVVLRWARACTPRWPR